MPIAAPVTTPATEQAEAEEPAFWVADRMPPSARVAEGMLSTCRAAGCAQPTARRSHRPALRLSSAPRRSW